MAEAKSNEFKKTIGGEEFVLTIGELAPQADASVTCQIGGTFVLATVVMSGECRPGVDYMPLLVEYEEKYYAAGKIKGSRFVKREGRPTDTAVTTSRMIDRALRPLFPDNMLNDVQVVTTVLSYDGEHQPDVPAMIAASTALTISRTPWAGPLAMVRVGKIDGQFVINPKVADIVKSELDLIVSGNKDEVVMIEAEGKEVAEDTLFEAIKVGQKEVSAIAELILDIQKQFGVQKSDYIKSDVPAELVARIKEVAQKSAEEIFEKGGRKLDIEKGYSELTAKVVAELGLKDKDVSFAKKAIREIYRDITREKILNEGKRMNSRGLDEVRKITARLGIVPRTHGSALFERGETQVLTTITLGSPGDAMLLDTMTDNDFEKRYMHFYNFPGFSVHEVRPNRGPGRRDIGHGALAEKAVSGLIPDKEKFGYSIMAVSEVLSSNGSSSMGSTCGSSLALMDAGVPIPSTIAGIAMGLVTDEKSQGRKSVVLTDIAGMEDEGCDMDFKVAGTKKGVTAVQVDIKTHGISMDVIEQAIKGAKTARLSIMETMEAVIKEARKEMSPFAPRLITIRINPEKIGDLIGPKGKNINKIIEETGVQIDVEDDGLVTITAKDPVGMEKAKVWVENLTHEVKAGERFDGRVTRLMNFGAFVEVLPGIEGMVHISELADQRVNRVEDVVKVGDRIAVVVIEIDDKGRINLSHKRAKKVE
ncbi:MAG: polyribonucleotide nucleotidyltransferase [bacterium]|nr:polyribonucleotide nucleotidyltransferase [bacterium]